VVSDTRHLTGIGWFLGSLYNHDAALFTLVTLALVPLTGIVLGFAADVVLLRLGIELRSRGVAEH
jgi:hypothetical protein